MRVRAELVRKRLRKPSQSTKVVWKPGGSDAGGEPIRGRIVMSISFGAKLGGIKSNAENRLKKRIFKRDSRRNRESHVEIGSLSRGL